MSALAHYLEEEGIPTVTLSLVREHTEALAPPRALWVPFMLGRPFGVPNDAAFQRKVLLAALQLFEPGERGTGPLLEDFPEDAPHSGLTPPPAELACPVSFPRMAATGSLAEQLVDEVTQLQAWHSVAMQWRKRTTLGVTGLTPPALAGYLAAWLAGDAPAPFHAGLSNGDAMKQACDELKAYYLEAKSAQPGGHTSKSLHDWFWLETACGKAIVQLRGIAAASADASLQAVSAISLVPRTVNALLKPSA